MDPTIKPWIDLWDYLDGNFWGFWRWAAAQLGPAVVGWQPVPKVASIAGKPTGFGKARLTHSWPLGRLRNGRGKRSKNFPARASFGSEPASRVRVLPAWTRTSLTPSSPASALA